ncbi:SDH family Clp fold serine proteinase [Nitratidesulfovibrio vulgaris]|uniref:SDH family Clp fold serine proteinase n=1 Tax=Nitratidesulfovibrio vulgaris TaxID=881 RepID=UPI0013E04F66|nr:SppA protein [Nitratidesulfovibrio vulgaris]
MSFAELNAIIQLVQDHYDADIYVHVGDITEPYGNRIREWLSDKANKTRPNALLILKTYGGSPDTAYRIARAFQIAYATRQRADTQSRAPIGKFYVYIDGPCMSAGTLIATGADVVILTERAEFGPLDTQIRKQDELGERTSGLVPVQAFDSLLRQSYSTFRHIFKRLRFDDDMGFSTRTAADIAGQLTVGLLGPVYGQIDPSRLAEFERLLNIGAAYGERLSNGNLKEGAIGKLLATYPTHSFIIDSLEARDIFVNIEDPSVDLKRLANIFCTGPEADKQLAGVKVPYSLPLRPISEGDEGASDGQ